MVEKVLEFYWRSHKTDFRNKEADNSWQQWQGNTELSLSDVFDMASPLCGKPAGRKARDLRLMTELFKHALTEPGSSVNVGIETTLKAEQSRNGNSVTVLEKEIYFNFLSSWV